MNEVEYVASEPGDLVVVGSSAGGVEALSILVSTLPSNFPAPIVLAQHLDPNRHSTLNLILQRRTSLSVEVVTSSSVLEAGRIYVVPSNRHVTIKDHHVEVQEDRSKRPRPSIDALLSTAAEAYGEHLIAVILTGSGSDGAAGAVDVKNAGGTVVVQNPQTARYPSMPLALPPTVVDFEAEIERIGPLLCDLLNGVSLPLSEDKTEDLLRDILHQVNRQASIDFRPYKTSTILRRIARRMAITHNHNMRDYVEYLKTHPQEVGELVKAFLINVTQFFRDADAFGYLKSEILLKLVTQARERDKVLRFWAAGCATGEEPYSLAMLLIDILDGELAEWSIKIFATDLDEAAITFARRGLYSENMFMGIPTEYRNRFFERVDHGYRIIKTLRQMVIFGQQDLSRSAPFPHIDLVLCRNVLIYFTPELQDYVLNQFAFSLSPDGYLFLGKAETARPLQAYYELISKHWKVYRCTGNSLQAVRRQSLSNARPSSQEGPSSIRSTRAVGKLHAEQEVHALTPEISQLQRFNGLLLRFLPTGVIVIDHAYHILTMNGAVRRLLGLREISSEQDFLHAVRGIPYSSVRNAIDTAFRERNTVTLPEVELDVATGGNGRFVCLSIALMQMEAGIPDLAVMSVTDVTEQVQTRRQLETVQAEQRQLTNELSTANKRLSDVNKDLLDSNEELQVANEELLLTHEELQASIEEFETTNEELQATNEELETNNEELQATNEELETNNEELETTNDELRARTGEMQELTSILESERVRLTEMVELAPFYIMVLRGPNLLVEAFNSRYMKLLDERVVQGRPLEEVYELFWKSGGTILQLAREAYQQNITHVTPRILTYLSEGQREPVESYYVHTIVPTHDGRGNVDGVVIYTADETQQRAKEIEDERERLKLIFDNANTTALALYDAQSAELVIGSPRYLDLITRMHMLSPDDATDRKWHESTVIEPAEKATQQWNMVLESRTQVRLPEVRLEFAEGEQEVVWDYTLTPIMDTERQDVVRFILVSAVEITEQVQLRKELERLDNLKDEFLSLATHELRTPLTAILGNVQMLQRNLRRQISEPGDEEAQRQCFEQGITILDKVIHQVSRMSTLITEMLDVTRMRGEMFELHPRENVNIVELVRRVVEQQDPKDHEIILDVSEETVLGTLDEGRIEQVLNNLLSNAIKYSPRGRQIVVTVECQAENANEVVISVQDYGFGISPEEQTHIFDRFYRVHDQDVKVEGLGLGLYIAHEIVVRQGGRMWLKSEPGEGSTFYFSLPLVES